VSPPSAGYLCRGGLVVVVPVGSSVMSTTGVVVLAVAVRVAVPLR
jgi:hypothetical protein